MLIRFIKCGRDDTYGKHRIMHRHPDYIRMFPLQQLRQLAAMVVTIEDPCVIFDKPLSVASAGLILRAM